MRVVLTAVAALVASSVAPASTGRSVPVPLRGAPLESKTGLHLLVSGTPPFVLDVDRGSTAPIQATPVMRSGVVSVQDLGGHGAVIAAGGFDSTVYILRRRGARPLALGIARSVTPDGGGRALWIKRAVPGRGCVLQQTGLDGRRISEPRTLACSMTVQAGGSLGLVGSRTRLFDPLTGRTTLTTRYGVLAAAGARLVLAGPAQRLTLLDARAGARRVLPWPSTLSGLDQPAADRQGRLVALAFGDPAWKGGPQQAQDVWIVDTRTGRLTQLPGMPAVVDLKFTSMEWTRDGRLVILARYDHKSYVAVWRPGEQELHVKRVRLPERNGGSDSFAVLP